jgi:Sulfotransferase family
MEALAARTEGLSKTDRMQLDFALGKAHADLKDYGRSFEHLLAGNAAKRATISYDENAAFALFDQIERVFSRELIAKKSGCGDPSTLPIFVIGMPRSGTTLIEQIIASHPQVHGAGELQINSAFVTDKMSSNYFSVGLIHLALPNAKIVHTMRDPVDTCVSCFSKLFSGEQTYTYDLGELGRYYRRYEQLMGHWRRVLPTIAFSTCATKTWSRILNLKQGASSPIAGCRGPMAVFRSTRPTDRSAPLVLRKYAGRSTRTRSVAGAFTKSILARS